MTKWWIDIDKILKCYSKNIRKYDLKSPCILKIKWYGWTLLIFIKFIVYLKLQWLWTFSTVHSVVICKTKIVSYLMPYYPEVGNDDGNFVNDILMVNLISFWLSSRMRIQELEAALEDIKNNPPVVTIERARSPDSFRPPHSPEPTRVSSAPKEGKPRPRPPKMDPK